jgi:hypothetical protein
MSSAGKHPTGAVRRSPRQDADAKHAELHHLNATPPETGCKAAGGESVSEVMADGNLWPERPVSGLSPLIGAARLCLTIGEWNSQAIFKARESFLLT